MLDFQYLLGISLAYRSGMETLWSKLQQLLTPERISALGFSLLRILLIGFTAWIAVKLVRRGLPKINERLSARMSKRNGQTALEVQKRTQTLGNIMMGTAAVCIWVIATMMALKEAGFDVAPILAGAGVVGLAVGFGAQNLVRDVITGALMLIENQIRVGDVAVINGVGGAVEKINLRTTTLRDLQGTVHVFSNGTIDSLSNMTHDFSYYLFEVGVAYKEDTDHVIEVLQDLSKKLQQEDRFSSEILEPLDVLGVDSFGDSAVIIKVRLKTRPGQQWMIGREMNRRIKKRFDELGIEIPFPHQAIYFGEASKPFETKVLSVKGELTAAQEENASTENDADRNHRRRLKENGRPDQSIDGN